MKKTLSLFLGFILLFSVANGQDKMLTMREAIAGYNLYPSGLSQLQWVDDEHYSYLDTLDGEKVIAIFEIESTNNGLSTYVKRADIESGLLSISEDSLPTLPRGVRWMNTNGFRF